MTTLIEFERVSRYFLEKQALVNIDCKINEGEFIFLTGHSGAGKSTFLKLIALQDKACEGAVKINNINLSDLSTSGANAYRRKIGFIHQSPRFIDDFTIAENVALPLRLRGFSYPEAQRKVRAALFKVGLLNRSQDYFHMLSGGERQRAEIARALVHSPMIILADEPTGNLDRKLSLEIMELLLEFNKIGTTVIIATHDEFLLQTYNYRIFDLIQGKLEYRIIERQNNLVKELVCEPLI
ncbi:ATP-binding cassette domain-containing protein [bacterium]|jgi:cell division transport system ATP-binding protein|nr:ATP-binding cassette domain-containing protein [bacterium]NBW56356.1 ATP-binding cassette domain-containing protein [bacterium]NBX72211.1 ATP-binding cassette domain-containing protein [bacterium]